MKDLLLFPFFYLREIVAGALRVARDVLSPRPRIDPVILRVPVELSSPRQRLLLACLVSMTPGSISVGEADGGRTLLVHSLYGGADPAAARHEIQDRYESVVARIPI